MVGSSTRGETVSQSHNWACESYNENLKIQKSNNFIWYKEEHHAKTKAANGINEPTMPSISHRTRSFFHF